MVSATIPNPARYKAQFSSNSDHLLLPAKNPEKQKGRAHLSIVKERASVTGLESVGRIA
jgi:hypothetical protein